LVYVNAVSRAGLESSFWLLAASVAVYVLESPASRDLKVDQNNIARAISDLQTRRCRSGTISGVRGAGVGGILTVFDRRAAQVGTLLSGHLFSGNVSGVVDWIQSTACPNSCCVVEGDVSNTAQDGSAGTLSSNFQQLTERT
jgi:hypothetical protein